MSAGRCAGCGFQNVSCQKVKRHVVDCPDYIELFRTDPGRALDPEEEYQRYKAEDDSPEARLDRKMDRIERLDTMLDARRQAHRERFTAYDPLLDDE